MDSFELPLFPLNTVLFPGGPLKVRIFETRYVDMIGHCMRAAEPFAVAMIVEGKEVGPARTVSVGTSARIVDFERLSDGLLGIVARGERRLGIQSVRVAPDGLNIATLRWREDLAAPSDVNALRDEFAAIMHVVEQTYPHVCALYGDLTPALDDANWLSARAAELLPVSWTDRQTCLELDDPVERLRFLSQRLKTLDELGRFP